MNRIRVPYDWLIMLIAFVTLTVFILTGNVNN